MIQWKLGCRSRKQKRKNQPIAKSGIEHCHWFILPLLLATPTMQFSLDRKQRRHKQNQWSASDSVGLIFTRSYRSTLLIATPTPTPSLVKTSLKTRKFLPLQEPIRLQGLLNSARSRAERKVKNLSREHWKLYFTIERKNQVLFVYHLLEHLHPTSRVPHPHIPVSHVPRPGISESHISESPSPRVPSPTSPSHF